MRGFPGADSWWENGGFLHRSIDERIAFDTSWNRRRDDGGWGTSSEAGVVLRDVVDGK